MNHEDILLNIRTQQAEALVRLPRALPAQRSIRWSHATSGTAMFSFNTEPIIRKTLLYLLPAAPALD
ncbi:hypothetical protein E2493_20815 [Sphingomonas parva]|uniref:Uncharacterized protein n=1 Tax=Sphingomonas parva TaxID=2555898 RepID=A0A4Y8ZMD7_9SPHN|nr:hypothetical protein [Sphingomonas parva]TFI56315.1 hypothetical protein E2493_20815 [Sphingomonas parva]